VEFLGLGTWNFRDDASRRRCGDLGRESVSHKHTV
jgi:hypothetical protein